MKTSTIKSVTFDKSFSTQHGTLFSHLINLENGDKGNINAKSELPDWLSEGKELSYEITANGNYPDKIKKVNPDYKANSGELKELIDRINSLQQVVKRLKEKNNLLY